MNQINRYEQNLLSCASSLDDIVGTGGNITQFAINIVQNNDDNCAVKLCSVIAQVAKNKNSQITTKAIALKNSMIAYYGHKQLSLLCTANIEPAHEEDKKNLVQLLEELNQLIGLKKVKAKVSDLIAYQKVQLMRKKIGLHVPDKTLHLAFTGNPGTGKTTVARIVGRIYKQLGLLSKGQFVEVSRTDLIAGYQGQTALKVKSVIDRARGGVLFIDEAYSITENDHTDSYGRECLTELTKALEDYRADLVVIVAGYTEPMHKFFDSNPGLKSRFNTFIEFDDYSSIELVKILESTCKNNDYNLKNSVKEKIQISCDKILSSKDNLFSNGRFIRNVFEDMMVNQARRLSKLSNPSKEQLQEFLDIDIPMYLSYKNGNDKEKT